ncbi:MAG: hypothetical protein ACR2K3_10240 [Nocardioides sp.]
MSAPSGVWAERVSAVGPGLGARRIFANLAQGPTSQLHLVEQAHAAGLLPVISYKLGGDAAGAAAGKFNAAAQQAAAHLASFDKATAVCVWHEPYGDMNGDRYAAITKQLLPIFRRNKVRVGPLLNGWLLNQNQSSFASYCPEELFGYWDWFGIDTYESGTVSNPGEAKPAPRIPALYQYLKSRGHGDLPIGVGEYNGYSGATIAAVGDALLTTPNVWFGCVWNVTGGRNYALTGDRLAAFRATLADARV